jgi:hypothetical protein
VLRRALSPGEFVLLDAETAAPVDYSFEVATSDRWQAGTTASVYVNLLGTQASTGVWAAQLGCTVALELV